MDVLKAVAAPAEIADVALGLRVQADKVFQDSILPGISRTYASVIPALPEALRLPAVNLYLLCHVAQIVHQRLDMPAAAKQELYARLRRAVEGETDAESLAEALLSRAPRELPPAERELLRNLPRLTRIAHTLPSAHRALTHRYIAAACEGLARFAALRQPNGLASLALFEDYCYCLGGAIGEALTALLCMHSPVLSRHAAELTALAGSVGRGLQMTNVLRDVHEERAQGACWLPREVFLAHGCNLEPGGDWSRDPGFHAGFEELIARAHGHLRAGPAYTRLIPRQEHGIRRYCLWPVMLALLILRRLHRRHDQPCRLGPATIRMAVWVSRAMARSNILLTVGFALTSLGLPRMALPAPAGAGPAPQH